MLSNGDQWQAAADMSVMLMGQGFANGADKVPLARSSSPAPRCQVEGCCADLSLEEKVYCFKKRICSYHMRAEVIVQPSDPYQQWRFCFQCGKLEPLSQFDGPKRSCRAMLERRKLPPRRTQSWTAGNGAAHSSLSSSCSVPPMPLLPQQQHEQLPAFQQLQQQMMLLEAQRQRLLLEKQVLLHQQQHAPLSSPLPAAVSTSGAAAAASAAGLPDPLALQQQQAALMQHMLQLQTAVAQMGGLPGIDSLSCSNNHNVNPSASLALAGEGTAQALPGGCMFSPAFSAAPAGFSAETMMTAGPVQQAQVQQHQQGAAPTAAAAAAAFAGSCGWPCDAAMATAAASAPAPAAAAARVRRHKSMYCVLGGQQAPDLQDDDLLLEMDVCDEFDPLNAAAAAASDIDKAEDAFMQELAAVFADNTGMEPAAAVAAASAQPGIQGAQQPPVCGSQAVAEAPAAAAGGASWVSAAAPHAPVMQPDNGCMPTARPSARHVSFALPPAAADGALNGAAMSQPLGAAPGDMQGQAQQQLQQLMHTMQHLQESVRQLSMQFQGGPAPSASATVDNTAAGYADTCFGLPGGLSGM